MIHQLDASVFAEDQISLETRRFNASVEERMTRAPARWQTPGAGILPASEPVAGVRELRIPGPGGELPIRIIRPATRPRGVYLHFHGGGFSLGAARHHDAMLAETAAAASVVTVSVDYRLAPEHPYPAAPADAEAAALWVLDSAESELDAPASIVIGGESAGAVLTATTALRLRDRHGFTGLAGLNLSQGAYDLRLAPGLRLWGDRRLITNTPTARCHIERYLQGADPQDPDVSPIFADLHDLPPALFTVGTLDPLLDDNGFFHFRWLAAGNRAVLDLYPGGIHGFTLFDLPIGGQARTKINDFIGASVTAGNARD